MKARVFALLALCTAFTGFLLWMVWDHEQARNNGTEIVLDMRPVDPRSLFRGAYVIIDTPLNRIDINKVAGDKEFNKGDPIFVSLRKDQAGDWLPQSITKKQPQTDTISIQGRVKYAVKSPKVEPKSKSRWVRVQYNIESYFADQSGAKALEDKIKDSKMRVILSVDDNGNAVIRGLEIDGERFIDKF